MKLPVIPTLDRQSFTEAPSWISKLLYPLQLFMTSVTQALMNNVSFQDNISCVVREFSIIAGAADTDNIFQFPFTLGRNPVFLSAIATNTDGTYAVVYPQVSFNFINGNVVINGIKGLTPSKKYNLVVTVA